MEVVEQVQRGNVDNYEKPSQSEVQLQAAERLADHLKAQGLPEDTSGQELVDAIKTLLTLLATEGNHNRFVADELGRLAEVEQTTSEYTANMERLAA